MKHICEHTEHVSAWIDGELPSVEARRLQDHFLVCQVCREERDALEDLSGMFSVLRDRVPRYEREHAGIFTNTLSSGVFRRVMSAAALVVIGLGALSSLAPDLTEQELRFERYLERSLDEDVLEMTSIVEGNISRDQVVGMLISSSH
jgi:hypothetical protein